MTNKNCDFGIYLSKGVVAAGRIEVDGEAALEFERAYEAYSYHPVDRFNIPPGAETISISVEMTGGQEAGTYQRTAKLIDAAAVTGGFYDPAVPLDARLDRLIAAIIRLDEKIDWESEDYVVEVDAKLELRRREESRRDSVKRVEDRLGYTLPPLFHTLAAFEFREDTNGIYLNSPELYGSTVAFEMHADEELLASDMERTGGALQRLYDRLHPILIEATHNRCLAWDPAGFTEEERARLSAHMKGAAVPKGPGCMVNVSDDSWWHPGFDLAPDGRPFTPETSFAIGYGERFFRNWLDALAQIGDLKQRGRAGIHDDPERMVWESTHPDMQVMAFVDNGELTLSNRAYW